MKNIVHNLIWIYKRCKKTFPLIVILIILGSLGSLLSVGSALATKKLIDSASSNNMNEVIKWIILFASLLLSRIIISSVSSIISTYSSEKTKNKLQENWNEYVSLREYVAVVHGRLNKESDRIVQKLKELDNQQPNSE